MNATVDFAAGTFALTYGQSIAALVAAMVVVVVVTAALETHTPTARRRSTRLTLPRRVEGMLDELPRIESVRGDYDRRLADVLTPKPSVLLRPGPNGPVPVTAVGVGAMASEGQEIEAPSPHADQGLPTEEVPIVFGPAWVTPGSVDPAARAVIRRIVSRRMVEAEARNGDQLFLRVPGAITGASEHYLEDEIAAALDRIDAQEITTSSAGTAELPEVPATPERELRVVTARSAERAAGNTPVFVVRPELPGVEVVELGEPGRERELAGVLFAAYVVSGGGERNRVTGWVSAMAAPPGEPDLDPGQKLRGRPGQVARLLACADDGRNWVNLDQRTDIRRGLNARPPQDPVLKGILWWWLMATDDAARVPAEHVAVMRQGLEAVESALDGHPHAATVSGIVEACRKAEAAHVGMRIESTSGVPVDREDRDVEPAGAAETAVAV